LTKQYEALIQSEDVSLEFTDDSLKEIARLAFQINSEVENIGARRLQTVVSKLLNDILFDIPEEIPPNAKVSITKEMVTERLSGLIEDKDLSEFML
jgi:ATP-dependent HslUV protease ATP-binding subunit HslU